MYGGKEKGSLATPPSEVSLLSPTSETPSGTASSNSIAENSGSVNSEYQKYLPKPRQNAFTDEADELPAFHACEVTAVEEENTVF